MKILALALLVVVPMSASAGVMEDVQAKSLLTFQQLAPGAVIPARTDTNEDGLFSLAQSVTDMNVSLNTTLTGVQNIAAIISLMASDKQERAELAQDLKDFSGSVDKAAVQSQSMNVAMQKISPASNSLGARAVLNNVLQARATVESLRTHSAALENAIEGQGDKLSFKTVQSAKDLMTKVDTLAGVLDSLAQTTNSLVH